MNTQTMIHTLTGDTAEPVTAPILPADSRAGDGYDWMDTLEDTAGRRRPDYLGKGEEISGEDQ
ncbi:hypothetical protein [Arthrobacter sp. UYCu712]|uniref:hypothetical protein n=1 Tax=Arthrobacter sp. UYCu712 TaxID=3156340 RepID=UPI00339B4B57